jgi:Rrf2 family protein
MNISSRCDYACRAVVALAKHTPSETPMTTTAIAEQRAIPEKYLPHILLQLKRAGIVRSVRGAQGGYLLAKTPENISLLDVVVAIDGPVLEPPPGMDSGSEDLAHVWRDTAKALAEVLRNVSIQSVLDSSKSSNMYFI